MASLEDLTPEARDELAMLARGLAENPATRKDFLRLTKRAKPDMPIPEIEIEDSTNRAMQQSEERVRQLEAKLQEKDAREDLERRRQNLMKHGKVSDESEIEAVEKIMLEKGITSHETAADYHRWMKEAAAPTPSGFNMNVIDDRARSTLSAYWKNPKVAARDEAARAFAELRGPRRPIGL
jgi:hypothetical protein